MAKKDVFERFLEAAANTGDIMLRLHYQHRMMYQKYKQQMDLERIKKEIADDVLARISVTVDAAEVVKQIDDVRHALEKLKKEFK